MANTLPKRPLIERFTACNHVSWRIDMCPDVCAERDSMIIPAIAFNHAGGLDLDRRITRINRGLGIESDGQVNGAGFRLHTFYHTATKMIRNSYLCYT